MSRGRTWLALGIGYGLILAAIWTEGRTQAELSVAAAAWIAAASVSSGFSAREMGLGFTGMAGALQAMAIALAAAGAILLAGWLGGTLHPLFGVRPRGIHSFGYAIWALMQQFILNSFFYLNLERLLGNRRKTAAAAVLLFASAHLPSPILTAATVVGAVFFVEAFRRYRNLYPLAVAHAALGLSLAMATPDTMLRHMRVGLGYLHFVVK